MRPSPGSGLPGRARQTLAKICFVVFLGLFLFSLLGGRTPP